MTDRRPLVGVVACSRQLGEAVAQSVTNRYLEACMRHADCAALLVPARPDLMSAAEIADRLDGLYLTGSPSNIAPARYGDEAQGEGPFDAGRDAMSLALIEAMIGRGRPVFGVCRGFQEVNVAFGGSLARDMGAEGRALSHHAPGVPPLAVLFEHRHEVTLNPDGLLAPALGRERLTVNSVHFQGVSRLGAGLTVEAAAPDGVVEAVSATVNGAPILAVQWHPEWQADGDDASIRLFGLFGRALRGDIAPWCVKEDIA